MTVGRILVKLDLLIRLIISFSLILLHLAPVQYSYAGSIVDPKAAIRFQPRILNSANGTQQIDITAPSSGGLSHNKFESYDIDTSGVILNNSTSGGVSIIGGSVNANNNLISGGSAKVILNEVTGSSKTDMLGKTEVFGDKADVIIANPNGVFCNGCDFINAGKVTITTGIVTPDYTNATVDINVNKGEITFEGNGVSAADLNLFSRQLTINSKIETTGRIKAVIGNFEYQSAGDNINIKDKSNITESDVIKSNNSGHIKAGSIDLKAVNHDENINLLGGLTAEKTNIDLSSSGDISITGVNSNGDMKILATGNIAINQDQSIRGEMLVDGHNVNMAVNSKIRSNKAVTINARASIMLPSLIHSNQSITLNAHGNIAFFDLGRILAQDAINMDAGNDILLNKSLILAKNGILTAANNLQFSESTLAFSDQLTATAQKIYINENVLFQVRNLTLGADDLSINSVINIENSQYDIVNNLTILNNGAIAFYQNNLNINNTIDNYGVIYFTADANISANSFISRENSSFSARNLEMRISEIFNNQGRFEISRQANIIGGNLNFINSGNFYANDNIEISAASIASHGIISAISGDLILKAVNNIDINGGIGGNITSLAAETIKLDTGFLLATDRLIVSANDLSVNSIINVRNSQYNISNRLNINSSGGILFSQQQLNLACDLTNNGHIEFIADAIINAKN